MNWIGNLKVGDLDLYDMQMIVRHEGEDLWHEAKQV